MLDSNINAGITGYIKSSDGADTSIATFTVSNVNQGASWYLDISQ